MNARDAYATKELAELWGISRQALGSRAKRESWQARKRQGRGGGNEWLLASMPAATRDAIAAAFLSQDAPAITSSAPAIPAAASLPGLTARQRKTALARLVFVREIERATALVGKEKAIRSLLKALADGSLAPGLAELVHVANDRFGSGAHRGLSRRRLYDWCAKFTEGGEMALAPRHRCPDMRVPEWAPAFLAHYQRPQKPALTRAYEDFAAEWTGKAPTIDAVRYWLKKMAMPSREAGRRTGNALLKLRLHKHRKTDELWPGDIYTADGTTFDAEFQHPLHGQPFKPEATAVIDVATRRCVGLSLGENENALVVLDALRMACLFGGIPCYFYTDNGPGYKNDLISGEGLGMMARLDIEMINSIPNRPQGKGLMERAVQTLFMSAAKRFVTCSHADMDRDAAKKIYKLNRKDVDAQGKSKFLPTFDELKQVIVQEVERYNARPHRALPKVVDAATGKRRHLSPDEYWNSFITRGFAPLLVPDAYKGELFMPGRLRSVSNGWVQLHNNQYFAKELEDFHGEKVEVRYDIWDASHVYCWTIKGEKICMAKLDDNAMDYLPMSQVEAGRERRDKGMVARQVKKIERIVPGATVQVPESPPTYTLLADSITRQIPEPITIDCQNAEVESACDDNNGCKIITSLKRPIFQSERERYIWLVANHDRWIEKDHDWIQKYISGEEYKDLQPYYAARGLAWSGISACG
ncbi:Mu transposase C-terminal domain-containing protein [Fundidesulfovibrio butyratiphilus]